MSANRRFTTLKASAKTESGCLLTYFLLLLLLLLVLLLLLLLLLPLPLPVPRRLRLRLPRPLPLLTYSLLKHGDEGFGV